MKKTVGEIMLFATILFVMSFMASATILALMYDPPLIRTVPNPWVVLWLPSVVVAYFLGWNKVQFTFDSEE